MGRKGLSPSAWVFVVVVSVAFILNVDRHPKSHATIRTKFPACANTTGELTFFAGVFRLSERPVAGATRAKRA